MVWVQVYSAQVPGSVEVLESDLRQVQGLESMKVMVPMLVEVSEKEWDLVPTAMDLNRLEELVEVIEPWESHLKLVKDLEKE
jgi:hypothetical protein